MDRNKDILVLQYSGDTTDCTACGASGNKYGSILYESMSGQEEFEARLEHS